MLTGGLDSDLSLFNTKNRKLVSKISGHTKRVNDVKFHPTEEWLFSCSQDRTVRVWRGADNQYSLAHNITRHTDDVAGISLHATGDFLASASNDKSWAFHDIHSGATLTKVSDSSIKAGYSSISFHPDGLILGTGTKDALVHVWDVKEGRNVATFEGHTSPVESLSFSENGYHLATAGGDSVKLWDLRKRTNFHNIPLSGEVTSVSFDVSGLYLIVSHGNSVRYVTYCLVTIKIDTYNAAFLEANLSSLSRHLQTTVRKLQQPSLVLMPHGLHLRLWIVLLNCMENKLPCTLANKQRSFL